jgi:hypothetical protein
MMKTAIYIEDGTVQLVITPETEFEKNALSTMRDKAIDAKLFDGSFYDCQGGWIRQTARINHGQYDNGHANDESLIIRVDEACKTSGD